MRGNNIAKAAIEATKPVSAMHAHHIVMRNGPPIGHAQDEVKASKAILMKRLTLKDGNPDHAWQNLIWAPNRGHTGKYVQNVRTAVEFTNATHLGKLGLAPTATLPKPVKPTWVDEMKETVKKQGQAFFEGTNT